MVQELVPQELAWAGITYNVNTTPAPLGGFLPNSVAQHLQSPDTAVWKAVLKNVSGVARPGRVLALMGPSGAGKTTLLRAISGRLAVDPGRHSLGGVCCMNNAVLQDEHKPALSFVTQDDIVMGMDTPREALYFSARMRSGLTAEEADVTVEEQLAELRLTNAADTIIGIPGHVKGVSGGEKKRANIGAELINNPQVLFLDEPTTGLDSVTALAVGRLLVDLARGHERTVVTTIHTPSSELFETFDDLLLIADGRIVFHGPREVATEYFALIGRPVPQRTNPSEHFMRVLQDAPESIAALAEIWATFTALAQSPSEGAAFTASLQAHQVPAKLTKAKTVVSKTADPIVYAVDIKTNGDMAKGAALAPSSEPFEMEEVSKTTSGTHAQARVLDVVKLLELLRDNASQMIAFRAPLDAPTAAPIPCTHPEVLSRVAATVGSDSSSLDAFTSLKQIGLGSQIFLLTQRSARGIYRDPAGAIGRLVQCILYAMLAGFFFFQMDLDDLGVRDRAGFLFHVDIDLVFLCVLADVVVFPAERPIFLKEMASASYSPAAYYMSKVVADIPLSFSVPVIYATIVYWVAGLSSRFEGYLANVAVMLALAQAAQALGMLVATMCTKIEIAMTIVPLLLYPQIIASGLLANTERLEPAFSWMTYVSFTRYAFKALMDIEFSAFPQHGGVIADGVQFQSGDDVIRFYGFTQGFDAWWVQLLMLLLFTVILRAAGVASMCINARQQLTPMVFVKNVKALRRASEITKE